MNYIRDPKLGSDDLLKRIDRFNVRNWFANFAYMQKKRCFWINDVGVANLANGVRQLKSR